MHGFSILDIIHDIISGPLFLLMAGYILVIAVSFLQVDKALHSSGNGNSEILMAMNVFMVRSFCNFILCSCADSVSASSLSVAFNAYQLEWYKFSVNEQQFIRLWIQRSQREFIFKAGGLITCSQATLLSVCSHGFIHILAA